MFFPTLRLAVLLPCWLLGSCGGGDDGDAAAPIDIVVAFPQLRFERPVFLTAAPGDDQRLFVITQTGVIHVFPNDPAVAATKVFLDLSGQTLSGGEQGLLGLAFDPKYQENGLFYVNYTPRLRGARRTDIVRFGVSEDPDVANAQSAHIILSYDQPFPNHKGGWLGFGPDGYLYIASGDGGSEGDPNNNGQNRGSLLGKILRVDRDGHVPRDNPYPAATPFDAAGSVWAYGLRNPYRASFDRDTGKLWAGDVGQDAWEEIDVIERGANYGWRKFEGNHVFNEADPDPGNAVPPIYEYAHEQDRCSIIGGYVYRGSALPGYQGSYFFADFCTGEVFALHIPDGQTQPHQNGAPDAPRADVVGMVPRPSSFGEDAAGELYLTSLNGRIYKLVPHQEGGP